MSDREALAARIRRAEEEVIALCKGPNAGGRRFTMRVPAEPDRDSDLVLMDGLAAGREALARSEGLDALRALSDAATPGPWHIGDDALKDGVFAAVPTTGPDEEGYPSHNVAWCHSDWREQDDAAFIVAAVNYVRAALSQHKEPNRG